MSSDDRYAQHLGIAITSILANRQPGRKIIFHILDGGMSEINKEKINSLVYDGIEIKFIQVNQSIFDQFPEMRHLKKATYYRLVAPSIINAPKLLYLDCDLIVCADIQPLYDLPLKGMVVGAAREISEKYVRQYFFRPIDSYFNAGVMLIDTEKWRRQKVWKRALDFLNEPMSDRKIKYADQDILNHLLEHNWLDIGRKYNFQLDRFQKMSAETDYAIIHFVGSLKPWHYMYDNAFGPYYQQYLGKSPWKENIFPDKKIWSPAIRYVRRLVHQVRLAIQKLLPPKIVSALKRVKLALNNRRDSR